MTLKLKWNKILATVGGVGFLPLAPGTWGAAIGSLLLIFVYGTDGSKLFLPLLLITCFFTWIGARIAKSLENEWGKDPKQFVLDELVGVWFAILGHDINTFNIILSFLLFRIFDIWKPFGIRRLENVKNGWGVMLDDVGAGIVSNILIWIYYFLQ